MSEATLKWKKTRDPALPTEPTFQHPRRCMGCGHLDEPDAERNIDEAHDPEVGCLVPGGTKYIEDADGNGRYACSCLGHTQPPPLEETVSEQQP